MIKIFTAVSLLASLGLQAIYAGEAIGDTSRLLSVAELKAVTGAPQTYKVKAYVVQKDDECPPCPPNAVCETCVLGIYVADEYEPLKMEAIQEAGLYLRTNDVRSFSIGGNYLFTIRYGLEKNAAGDWRRTGPELIDFSSIR